MLSKKLLKSFDTLSELEQHTILLLGLSKENYISELKFEHYINQASQLRKARGRKPVMNKANMQRIIKGIVKAGFFKRSHYNINATSNLYSFALKTVGEYPLAEKKKWYEVINSSPNKRFYYNLKDIEHCIELSQLIEDEKTTFEWIEKGLKDLRNKDQKQFQEKYLGSPLEIDKVDKLSTNMQVALYREQMRLVWKFEEMDEGILSMLEKFLEKGEASKQQKLQLVYMLIKNQIFLGNTQEAFRLIEKFPTDYSYGFKPAIAFLSGRFDEAYQQFQEELPLSRKGRNSTNIFFRQDWLDNIYFLSLFQQKKTEDITLVKNALEIKHPELHFFLPILIHLHSLQDIDWKYLEKDTYKDNDESYYTTLMQAWLVFWYNKKLHKSKEIINRLEMMLRKATKSKHLWFQFQLADVLAHLAQKETHKKLAKKIAKKTGFKSFASIVDVESEWKRSLSALNLLVPTAKNKEARKMAHRIAYLVDFENDIIELKEQNILKSGKWGKGKAISYERFVEGRVKGMTQQDINIAATIVRERNYWGYEYQFDLRNMYREMVGHPYLFLHNNPSIGCELISVKPTLIVEKKKGQYEIRLSETLKNEQYVIKETNTRYKYVDANDEVSRIAEIIQKAGKLRIPKDAEKELADTIESLSAFIPVQSVVGNQSANVPSVEADHNPYLQIVPMDDGFKLEIFVKPFAKVPPYFKPGKGGKNIFSEVEGQTFQTNRDFKLERKLLNQLLAACPLLAESQNKTHEYYFETPVDCLEVLTELEEMGENKPIIEWPKGSELELKKSVSIADFKGGITSGEDWFALEGEVKIDNNTVLKMHELLQLLEDSNGRFVQMNDGSFLALTNAFRKQLRHINSIGEQTKNGIRLNNLAAWSLEDWANETENLKVDKAWKSHIKRLNNGRKKQFTVPKTFKAELRPYQLTGFKWLSRLSYWQVGACLADDMGLGKTVQALAVMLSQAKNGPSLVVAPTSVIHNWQDEALKFAPSLRPMIFGKGDRAESLKGLDSFDLVICSYGLLQSESDLITKIKWNTIALDEAQAIKNKDTKRSKAAMQLKAKFKMVTTGTPIENHLLELWNLFRFLNPGLLGSQKSFQEKFATPIEKHKNIETREQLKNLIQPFILRRKKNQVLKDLPEKTEITLKVELSKEEKAFYEALRVTALEKIEGSAETGGAKHLRILAEISKLRQACCHPKMVDKSIKLSSAKLTLFDSVIDDLIENGHKVLVFSQFVKHLTIIKDLLNKKKIKYQYLDGSTPAKVRRERVNDFQSGIGDLFLISLKAGGTGLNLTAADYVIHMDPWWNPAVEDQASDRAHRIGQKRPVTIYRIIAENTIEEKIVRLHHTKKELADSLLSGTEASGKLSADDLLKLIKDM